MSQIRLQQDGPLRIETQHLKSLQGHSQESWIEGVAEAVSIVPFPGEVDATVDPVICRLCSLPVLIGMLTVPSKRTGFDKT